MDDWTLYVDDVFVGLDMKTNLFSVFDFVLVIISNLVQWSIIQEIKQQ